MILTPQYSAPKLTGCQIEVSKTELVQLQWLLGIIVNLAATGDVDKSAGDAASGFLSAIGTPEALL